MRRISRLLSLATVAVALGACTDPLTTETPLRRGITPQIGSATIVPVTPVNGGMITSPTQTIDVGTWPRVSGDLMCYMTSSFPLVVKYFRFSTGVYGVIPGTSVGDGFCDVSGDRIAFTRYESDRWAVMVFDAATSVLTEVDPKSGAFRPPPVAIGSNTVAFTEDLIGNFQGVDVIAVDLSTGTRQDIGVGPPWGMGVNLSPDGNLLVWYRVDGPVGPPGYADNNVLKSVRTGGIWGTPDFVANSTGSEMNPVTDGSYIAWGGDLWSATGEDIYFQPVGGGDVAQLPLPGIQHPVAMGGGVILVWSQNGGPTELMAYVIATNTLYQAPAGAFDVTALPNGKVGFVGQAADGNVYATGFTPSGGVRFGGFRPPVKNPPAVNSAKAGQNVILKFSLGGDWGSNPFASGSPSSTQMQCAAGTPTGTAEQTLMTGNSTLRYDATSDTYIYNWNTERAWAGQCRRLTIQFVEGTVVTAEFKFN